MLGTQTVLTGKNSPRSLLARCNSVCICTMSLEALTYNEHRVMGLLPKGIQC